MIIHLFRDVIDDDVELVLVLRDRHLVLRLCVRPQHLTLKLLKACKLVSSYIELLFEEKINRFFQKDING